MWGEGLASPDVDLPAPARCANESEAPASSPDSAEHIEETTAMGTISVHEFITLDGVIDEPSWTRD